MNYIVTTVGRLVKEIEICKPNLENLKFCVDLTVSFRILWIILSELPKVFLSSNLKVSIGGVNMRDMFHPQSGKWRRPVANTGEGRGQASEIVEFSFYQNSIMGVCSNFDEGLM